MNDAAARFKQDTANHRMTVLHDDGLYRHLRFKAPGTGAYWFDLITWPGSLAVRGDIEGYMFTRVEDMFTFFRMHRTEERDGRRKINPAYWSEKVEGGRDATKTYSQDRFRDHVIEYFKDVVKDGDAPRGLGKAIREEILNDPDVAYEDTARKLVESFEYGRIYFAHCTSCGAKSTATENHDEAKEWEVGHETAHTAHVAYVATEPKFAFYDTWEWDLRDYDFWFLWACHAIVFGIREYDLAKARTLKARVRRALAALRPHRAARKAVAA